MNLDILEKKMPEAIKYASNIITETPNFIEFAIAITDYMGKDFIPYCKSVYMMLVNLSEISGITSKNGRNDAKRLNIRVVTMSNDDKPKNRKTQRKADLRRRMVCKSLPVKE